MKKVQGCALQLLVGTSNADNIYNCFYFFIFFKHEDGKLLFLMKSRQVSFK